MTQREDSKIIGTVHPICCGLDVHKESISACVIYVDKDGTDQYDIKVFGTFTDDLMRLRSWLLDHECPVVAMESTGIYWRPVHNVLEDALQVVLVNARDIKNVPGRKTDIGRNVGHFPYLYLTTGVDQCRNFSCRESPVS